MDPGSRVCGLWIPKSHAMAATVQALHDQRKEGIPFDEGASIGQQEEKASKAQGQGMGQGSVTTMPYQSGVSGNRYQIWLCPRAASQWVNGYRDRCRIPLGADQESLLPTSKCPNVDQHKIFISVSSFRGVAQELKDTLLGKASLLSNKIVDHKLYESRYVF